LNADNGNEIWSYTTGGQVWSSPAISDGKVYVGSFDGKMYCLDAVNGNEIWSYTTGAWVWSSPAVYDGKVYIGSDDFKVYCLDAVNGNEIWRYTTFLNVISSPAISDGKVYIGSTDGDVYCLDADDGNKIWSYFTGENVISSPAVADGKVYIGSLDGKVYCFGDQGGEEDIEIEIHGGFRVSATITNTGTSTLTDVEWSIDLTGGWIILQGQHTEDVIPELAPDESKTITQTSLFGIGPVTITVTVNDATETASGFILGPLALGVG
jgi:outer membrane protein assembly factor BamB